MEGGQAEKSLVYGVQLVIICAMDLITIHHKHN